MEVVVGYEGVRVTPLERSRQTEIFSFMAQRGLGREAEEGAHRRRSRAEMQHIREAGGRIVVVAGPAVVHTGAGRYLSRLIELGYVQVLFAGNALAVHDVESALFGTALGVNIESGVADASTGTSTTCARSTGCARRAGCGRWSQSGQLHSRA